MASKMVEAEVLRGAFNASVAGQRAKRAGQAGRPLSTPERSAYLTVTIDHHITVSCEMVGQMRGARRRLRGERGGGSFLDVVTDALYSDPEVIAETLFWLRAAEEDFLREWRKTVDWGKEPTLGTDYFSAESCVLLEGLLRAYTPPYREPSRLVRQPGRLYRTAYGDYRTTMLRLNPYTRLALYKVAERRTDRVTAKLGKFPRKGDSVRMSVSVSDVVHDALLRDPEIVEALDRIQPNHDFRMVISEVMEWVDVTFEGGEPIILVNRAPWPE